MKLAHFDGFEVTGFENSGGWRLHVRDQPPNPMNELIASPLVPVTPQRTKSRPCLRQLLNGSPPKPLRRKPKLSPPRRIRATVTPAPKRALRRARYRSRNA